MSDTEFLYGDDLSGRIRMICAEDEVDCAVAFWGGSMRDDLFPHWKQQRSKVRIICDISMGCNSRMALKHWGAPKNNNLRVLDDLHVKVYISRAGAIVASANASTNGIGRSGMSALNCEAGTFFPANSAGWSQAANFFNTCLQRSLPLDKPQLERAPRRATDPRPRIGKSGLKTTDLLTLVAADPDMFGDILFIGEYEEISASAKKKSVQARDKYEVSSGEEMTGKTLVLRHTLNYLPFPPRSVVMLWRGRWVAYNNVISVPEKRHATLWGEEGWRNFWSEPRTVRPVRKPLPETRAFLERLGKGQWAMRATDLVGHWLSAPRLAPENAGRRKAQ